MDTEPTQAERAFDALRAEIGQARTELRDLAVTVAARAAPDYDPSLVQIARHLAALTRRIAALEARPVASYEPRDIIRLPGEAGTPEAALQEAAGMLQGRACELAEVAGVAVSREAQRWRIAGSIGLGAVAGIGLCLGTVGMFPERAGAWIAATIVGRGPWEAGQVLMRQGSPESFARMVRLYQACGDQPLELCEAAIAVRTLPESAGGPVIVGTPTAPRSKGR